MTTFHAEKDIDYAIELAQKRLEKIINLKDDEINYQNVFVPYDNFATEL